MGDVSYVQSQLPAGTVIAQSITAHSSLKEGSYVSFSVSAGIHFNEKKVPDLYGLTIDEARERLAEAGLVCGRIFAVENGSPAGIVIAQSPTADTPIGSGLTSVDLYVSS